MSTLEQVLEQAASIDRVDALLDRIQLQLDNITLEIKRERYRRFVEEVIENRAK